MLTALPQAAPRETVYSICARTHVLLGHSSSEVTSRLLFGYKTAARHRQLPCNLSFFAAATADAFGTAREVLTQRTGAGLTLRFAGRKKAEEIVDACLRPEMRSSWTSLIGRSDFSKPSSTMWACAECSAESWQLRGIRPLLVPHQWPGVYACPKHGMPLRRACLGADCGVWKRFEDLEFEPPVSSWSDATLSAAIATAQTLEALLQAEPISLERMRVELGTLLGQERLINTRRRPRKGQIAAWWVSTRAPFLAIDPSFDSLTSGDWIGNLVVGRNDDDPVKWSVLLAALLPQSDLQMFLRRCRDAQLSLFNEHDLQGGDRDDVLSVADWRALATGKPIAFVAERSGRSQAAVRYWLRRHPAIAKRREHELAAKQVRARRAVVLRVLRREGVVTRASLYAAYPAAVRWLERNDREWFSRTFVGKTNRFRQRSLGFE